MTRVPSPSPSDSPGSDVLLWEEPVTASRPDHRLLVAALDLTARVFEAHLEAHPDDPFGGNFRRLVRTLVAWKILMTPGTK